MVIRLFVPLAAFCVAATFSSADDRPNFLLIIADDLTWSDLGYEGHTEIKTPHLDTLRTQGMHLTRMFTPATTCSPSRHALYTGLYSIRSGAYPNHTRVYDGTKSLFTHLKNVGYRVGLQNKSHVGPPASFPYEAIKGADDLTSTEAFLRRDDAQPWFLVYASNDPHSPWNRGPQSNYDPQHITVPAYLHDNAITRKQLANYYAEVTMLDTQVGRLMELLTTTGHEQDTLVMFVSEQGSSFPYGGKWSLYDNGIRASTLVRWPGKVKPGSTTDALVQYVDVPPTFLEAAGVDPTTIDVGCPDAEGKTGFDGRSFLAVLNETTHTFRDYVFAQHTTVGIIGYQDPYPMRSVRSDRYKLIANLAPDNTYSIGGIHKGPLIESWQKDAETDDQLATRVDHLFHRPEFELYDLVLDPLERNNVADDPEYQATFDELRDKLDQWMRQQGDEGMPTELKATSRQGKDNDDANPKSAERQRKKNPPATPRKKKASSS